MNEIVTVGTGTRRFRTLPYMLRIIYLDTSCNSSTIVYKAFVLSCPPVRSALNEKSLERYLESLLADQKRLSMLYEDWAFLR